MDKNSGSNEGTQRGRIFIVVSPSGGGKSTICNRLAAEDDNLFYSVSFTSRAPRAGEAHGSSYYFISAEEFKDKVEKGDFLEWAIYVENMYGTDRWKSEEILSNGTDLLMDIEVQGGEILKKSLPECVRIFILPPSKNELKRRIENRGSISAENLKSRLDVAEKEIRHAANYDYVVINDDLDKAVSEVRAILHAERLKVDYNKHIVTTVLRSFSE